MKHPNATVALGSGSGLGTLAAYLLGLAGVHLTPEASAATAGAIASIVLFVGRHGLRGALRTVWRGSNGNGAPPV